nr:uncharacterized protein LOC109150167 [Ipomoea trifida]
MGNVFNPQLDMNLRPSKRDRCPHAVYKVPSELCRKALRKRRRRLAKNGGFPVWDDSLMRMHRHTVDDAAVEPPDEDAVELEREMWNKFSGAGFWRSPSQRTDLSQL